MSICRQLHYELPNPNTVDNMQDSFIGLGSVHQVKFVSIHFCPQREFCPKRRHVLCFDAQLGHPTECPSVESPQPREALLLLSVTVRCGVERDSDPSHPPPAREAKRRVRHEKAMHVTSCLVVFRAVRCGLGQCHCSSLAECALFLTHADTVTAGWLYS